MMVKNEVWKILLVCRALDIFMRLKVRDSVCASMEKLKLSPIRTEVEARGSKHVQNYELQGIF
jgi:hypothetical protein